MQAGSGWNNAPIHQRRNARKDSVAWTRDGLLLDRLVIIPGVPAGEPLLTAREKTAAMPVFRVDMLPNELEELVESTIVKFFGEGQAVVNTENLRPHRFGNDRGVLFDLSATVTESPEYKGLVGAFIAGDKLYVLYFLGATPYYYDKHIAEAEAIIKSAIIQLVSRRSSNGKGARIESRYPGSSTAHWVVCQQQIRILKASPTGKLASGAPSFSLSCTAHSDKSISVSRNTGPSAGRNLPDRRSYSRPGDFCRHVADGSVAGRDVDRGLADSSSWSLDGCLVGD